MEIKCWRIDLVYTIRLFEYRPDSPEVQWREIYNERECTENKKREQRLCMLRS